MKSKLYSQILAILHRNDPIKLKPLGVPRDEYSPEAQEIAQNLKKCKSVDEINLLVYNSFVKFFEFGKGPYERNLEHISKGDAGNEKDYMKVAKEISLLLGNKK